MLQLSGAYWLAKCTVTPNLHSSHRARSHFGCFFLFTEYKSLISFSINQPATTKAATISPVFTPMTQSSVRSSLQSSVQSSLQSPVLTVTASFSSTTARWRRSPFFPIINSSRLPLQSSSTAASRQRSSFFSIINSSRLPLHQQQQATSLSSSAFIINDFLFTVSCSLASSTFM